MKRIVALTLAALMLFSCALTFPHGGKQLRFEAMPAWAEGEFPSDSL